jgi:hypothetical protein
MLATFFLGRREKASTGHLRRLGELQARPAVVIHVLVHRVRHIQPCVPTSATTPDRVDLAARSQARRMAAPGCEGRPPHRAVHPYGYNLAPRLPRIVAALASLPAETVILETELVAGTKNAPTYNQAARNVACMAQAIAQSGRRLDDFTSLAFFVVAPTRARRPPSRNGIEQFLEPNSIKSAVRDRIAAYETGNRTEATDLKAWEQHWFLPLVDRLADTGALRLLAWEDCIEAVTSAQPGAGADLSAFYDRCLALARAVTTITSD